MQAPRPSHKRPYAILVGPVPAGSSALSEIRPALCVVISDPDHPTRFVRLRLKQMYGLTEAEARLAACLADGEKLRTAAAKLGITYATSRSRLAEIFQKTDTRSQHELVAVLLKTLAG